MILSSASSTELWFEQALLPVGWARNVRMTLQRGRIASIDEDTAKSADAECHGIALPGLSNLHCHAFQRGMAGLTERRGSFADNFWTWREMMYHFVGHIGPDELEAIAGLAYVEMLECGFTRVGEFHYVHRAYAQDAYEPIEMIDALCAAASATGIALTLLPSFYAHSNFGGTEPTAGQRSFTLGVDRFARLVEQSRASVAALPQSVVGVAPHSLRAVTPDELKDLIAVADGGPIHIHAAEQVKEIEDCIAWSGVGPVQWLVEHAPVDRRWCVIHATHMTPAETAALARSGAVAGLCPITEANLGDGIFPTGSFLREGGGIGIGTDSNVLISAAEELRALEYFQRLETGSRNVLACTEGASTGGDLFRAALAGGAQALGVPGGLSVGSPADFLTLNKNHPSLYGRDGDTLLDSFIFAAGHAAIDCVWRAGVKVVREGRHQARTAVEQRYRTAIGKVMR